MIVKCIMCGKKVETEYLCADSDLTCKCIDCLDKEGEYNETETS